MRIDLSLALSRLLNRKVALTLLWTCAFLSAAVVANIIGIRALGSTRAWEHWLTDHRWHLFAWRVALYLGTAYGWLWMRRRVIGREESSDARIRLRRSEVAAVVAVVSVEIITLIAAR